MGARITDLSAFPPEKSTIDRAVIRLPASIRFTYQLAARLSPRLGAEVARHIFFRPLRMPYRTEQSAILATARHDTLQVRGLSVRTYCWGEDAGPVVLLMHGWGGHAGQMTEFVAPLVQAGYRVIALDAPAHGRSAGRLSSIVHFSEAIEALAAAFGPLNAVIAHSMGATATVQALSHGQQIGRAVFIAPQARITGYWRAFREVIGMSDAVWTHMQAKSERWLNIRYDQLHPADIAPRMTTPLLILHGTTDRMTPISEGEALAAAWPGARLQPLDCGHLAILRDARALAASLDFIKG